MSALGEPLSGPQQPATGEDRSSPEVAGSGRVTARHVPGNGPYPPLQGLPVTAAYQRLILAAGEFTATWAEVMASLPDDYGFTFNCDELDSMLALFDAAGHPLPDSAIMKAHKASEGEDGCRHWPGWESDDGDGIPGSGPAVR